MSSANPDALGKKKVLFLCTGNSCRSQMAEAIVKARLGETWQAFSAGTKPAGYIHPMALAVLEELGIHHAGRSKSVDEFRNVDFDLVVTVCDSAAEECPVWLPVPRPGEAGGKGKKVHHGFPDPAKTEGTKEEIMQSFRSVCDDMERKIIPILSTLD
jgi:arsenate reductase